MPRNTEDCEPATRKKPEKGIGQTLPTALRGNQLDVRLLAARTRRIHFCCLSHAACGPL